MPIITKTGLPVNKILREENVQVLEEQELNQENTTKIIEIAILNLMPLKEDTELQLLRKLSTSGQNIKVTFCNVMSYTGKNTNPEHMAKFYATFQEIEDKTFDGLIITGAPVEQIKFEEVIYWNELTKIMDWSKTNVKSTLYICWGAQAGLYYNYNINKELMNDKKFGVFKHQINDEQSMILHGFKEGFKAPHSRHTTIKKSDVEKHPELSIVSESEDAGIFIVENKKEHQIFVTGHLEYAKDTLDKEYKRDLGKGLKIEIPENYYENDDPQSNPIYSWEENGNHMYSNWVNYYLT